MKNNLIYTFLALVMLSSCTEKIDIELDETYARLVVDGFITTDTTVHTITLTKTTNYYYNEMPPPVTGAEVSVTDEDGNEEVLQETDPGVYVTSENYYAIEGKTYTLRILLEEAIDNETLYEASSKVLKIYPVDSVSLAHHPDWGEEGFYEVQCYYQDPPEKNWYMFNIFKNGVLMTDTINKRFVTNDEFYNGNYTNGIGVGYLDQSVDREKIYPGDIITFQAANIEKAHADFIWRLQEEVGYQLPLFSGPPANVNGNISHGAIGYFAVYSVTYSYTISK